MFAFLRKYLALLLVLVLVSVVSPTHSNALWSPEG
jgi:hypothetical protein